MYSARVILDTGVIVRAPKGVGFASAQINRIVAEIAASLLSAR